MQSVHHGAIAYGIGTETHVGNHVTDGGSMPGVLLDSMNALPAGYDRQAYLDCIARRQSGMFCSMKRKSFLCAMP